MTAAIRMPVELIEALDRYVVDLAKELQGVNVTRNDAMRRLMTRGLVEAGYLDPVAKGEAT